MTEEKKGVVKKHAVNGTKLFAAVAGLTAAVNGYNGLLEKQEQILYVISSKINSLTEKIAYLEGRIAGQSHELASETAKVKVQPVSVVVMTEDGFEEAGVKLDLSVEPEPTEGEELVAADNPGEPSLPIMGSIRPMRRIKNLAYQQMPVKLDNLEQFQRQIQMQEKLK